MCIVLFVQLPLEKAAIWSILGGYLLLPSGISVDVHLLPPLDKSVIPALAAYLVCLMKGATSSAPRRSFIIYLLACAFVMSPLLTTFGNSYELHIGDRSIPGFYPANGLKLVLQNILTIVPFFLGKRFLSSDEARLLLLKTLPTSALLYSVPMLFELRMSPQLQRMVYGAAPSAFAHMVRAGGYRPVVFLSNGLELALFISTAFVAALIVARARGRLSHISLRGAAAYLGCLLLLCKTLGSILYGVAAAPLVLLTKPRLWVRISCVMALIVCAYPALRTADVIPVRGIVAAADTLSAARGGSLQFRLDNEDKLLAKANQKWLFGWGTWGRNRVYDQDTGSDESVTDGEWIIRFGMFGWFGYLSLFGLLAASLFRARARVRGPMTNESAVVAGMALLLAINMVDLIPNANLVPLTFVIAGSLAGCVPITSRVAKGARGRPAKPAEAVALS